MFIIISPAIPSIGLTLLGASKQAAATLTKYFHMQGFNEINGTSEVPNSDIPSWVAADAEAKAAGSSSGSSSGTGNSGQSVDVPDRFTLPVAGDVASTNPLTSGQATTGAGGDANSAAAAGSSGNGAGGSSGGAPSGGRKLSSGQIAGATIGSLAGAGLLAAAGFYAARKLRPAKTDSPETMATFNQAFNSQA